MSEREEIRNEKAAQLRDQMEDADGAGEDREEPVHVESTDHLDELVEEGGVVLADFYADWCGPCKMIEPVVRELAAETPATVAKVDVDVHQQLAADYQVQGVPTLYLFADGEPVEQLVGVQEKSQLRSLIEQYA